MRFLKLRGFRDGCHEIVMMNNIRINGLVVAFLLLNLAGVSHAADCRVLDPELAQRYEGGCKDGLADGYGRAWGKAYYEGRFAAGMKHGQAVVKIWPNGDRYNGQYLNDLRHGFGVYEWANGDRYEGLWLNDERQGYSVMEMRQALTDRAAAETMKKKPDGVVCQYKQVGLTGHATIRARVKSVTPEYKVELVIIDVDEALAASSFHVNDILTDNPMNWDWCS